MAVPFFFSECICEFSLWFISSFAVNMGARLLGVQLSAALIKNTRKRKAQLISFKVLSVDIPMLSWASNRTAANAKIDPPILHPRQIFLSR